MFRYNVAAFLESVLEIRGFRVSLKSRDFERIHMINIELYSNVTQVYRFWEPVLSILPF